MPLRWRLRTLMVAVAVVGLSLGIGIELVRRHRRYQALAAYHVEHVEDERVACPEPPGYYYRPTRRGLWHVALYRKYRDAARRPWLPVAPDPPPPK